MVDIFIQQTRAFIEKSGIKFQSHSAYTKAEISPDGQSVAVFISGTTSRGYNNQEFLQNYILQISTLFLLFDVFLDSKYKDFVGESFNSKYKNLPYKSDVEIVQKEIYGILKIFRNALTHGMHSINVDNSSVLIDRKNQHDKRERLQFHLDSLEHIFTAIIMIIDGIKTYREECYLKYFYQQIIAHIEFEDGDRNTFLGITDTTCLRCNRLECELSHSLYSIGNEQIEIKYQKEIEDSNLYDYILEVKGKSYMIPEEMFTDNTIPIKNIEKWKV